MTSFDAGLFDLLRLALIGLALWGLIDAATRPAPAFPAASKLSKPIWLAILAAATLFGYLFGLVSLPGSAAAVAAIVYLVDVRPAVRALRPGGPWG